MPRVSPAASTATWSPVSLMIAGVVSATLATMCPAGAQNAGATAGEAVFMQGRCYVCHGQEGYGGVGPGFRNDTFLNFGDYVVGQIILGRGVMPPFGPVLNDAQIAAVASYIRNNWGNHFGEVKADEVAQIREQLAAQGKQASK